MKAALATIATFLLAGVASANVTVSGTGKVTYVPDLVYVNAGVTTDAKTAAEAWQKNAEIVKKLFEVLKKAGIDPKDIKTSGLNLSPVYEHPPHQKPVLVGYSASYNLSITVRKLDDVGTVLDELVENGANRGMGIAFGHSEMDRLIDEAKVKAVTEARKKAELYAKGAGAALGGVVSISEGQAYQPQYYRFDHMKLASGEAHLPIAAGEQDATWTVTVVYAINNNLPPRT